ncbi:MAG: sugar phosphate nucleotidyltransferase [Firmicutes bacterium]|nr:sugar phosphate nucleotidyltransferase [Bacillota bacterium]MDD4264161.1 sugar phosphate nucleotidyltransferase [Bacillota bacterium]MDD4694219.1 sugar phosphate nucleotidyltransferase [Bacillota bacterium]
MDYALVLAGGLGQRLWPISRKQNSTKEAVDIHSQTMLELTVSRLSKWVGKDRIWIVSSKDIETYGCKLIKEPFRKNTAAAISWGLSMIASFDKDAFVGIFPVDHLISPWESVVDALNEAKSAGKITALAIELPPKKASKQYGYLKTINGGVLGRVEDFVEKPSKPEELLQAGYYVNSGIYAAPAKKLLAEIRRFLPNHFFAGKNRDRVLFSRLQPVSIDKGVMEKTNRLFAYPLEVLWEDIGTWQNYLKYAGERGNFVKHESEGSLVYSEGSLVVLSGVKDTIVVSKDGIVFVMNKDYQRDMDKVLDEVRKSYPGFA